MIPVAQTAPDSTSTNSSRASDGDTRASLQVLLAGAGVGLKDNGHPSPRR